ncbi:CPBP family intramembrane glutamic endopeptidase [Galbibacter mesophilus]|uniref:CPBP family intramembrane glutamic endopeptidase n=1 Tax=Galbibacter mesophilus TaxID=379069 RepID=UPI001F5D31C6|nr:CPBP family intramembrane glutamic endopeptidase [Galbibacter mesophilus]MCM5663579.1 CPBP family intramembrane metalloprotease [Galbibacter mesophilus]
MKYIEQVFNYKYDFWRYIVGSFVLIIMSQLMQIPFALAIVFEGKTEVLASGDYTKIMGALEPNLNLFLLLLPFAVCLPILFFIVQKVHNQSLRSLTTGRRKVDWKRILFSFFLWGGFTILITLIDINFVSQEDYVFNFKPIPFLILFLIAVLMVPLQTSLEEYVFRGYLMQGFGALFLNKWAPLLLTSLIFGGLHLFNPEVSKLGYGIMVYYIGTGLFLGIITLMDDGMELSLGFHAANNLITALLVTANWTAFQTHSIYKDVSSPELGWDVFVPVLIIFPLLLLLFAKIYKWNNWKERLTGTIEKPTPVDKMEETISM